MKNILGAHFRSCPLRPWISQPLPFRPLSVALKYSKRECDNLHAYSRNIKAQSLCWVCKGILDVISQKLNKHLPMSMGRFSSVFGGGGLGSPEAFSTGGEACPSFAWVLFSVWPRNISFLDAIARSWTSTCLFPWPDSPVFSEEEDWNHRKPFWVTGKPVHHSPGCRSLCGLETSIFQM